ncbi:MAG: hypothetical protein IJO45_00325 [Oscillospiraceae bacterium]|nr:hypothetical protein [Oscillospiraceae bacterium]
MKKLIVVLSCLLLCGCAANQEQAELPSTTEKAAEPTQEVVVSLYDADSAVEKESAGAVRAYPLGDGIYTDLCVMGDKLLVVSSSGDITILKGEQGQIVATEATDLSHTEAGLPLWTSPKGAGYYVPESAEAVLLDPQLLELARIPMPGDIQGDPVILLQRNEVFYCTAGEIRAMDIQTGISRLVRSHSCASQQLTGSYFNDTVLGCRITDEQGAEKVIYLYADTGTVVAEDITLGTLYTEGTAYFAMRSDDQQTQILFGQADGETMCLETEPEGLTAALALGGAVRCTADEAGLTLSFYDFTAGTNSAEVVLPALTVPMATVADGDAFWFIIDQTLYRWDPAKSATGDDTNYVSQLYTQQNPDTQGLEQCQKRVEELKNYGIDLRIWTDATADTGEYTCQPEYRVSTTEQALTQLEEVFKQLPEGFLATTGSIRVSLVRSVGEENVPVQYWQGNTCCVIIPAEQAVTGFLWGLGHGIDARVLGNSRALDAWNQLNPGSFAYTYDYAANAVREDGEKYLDDFVDLTAMSFPTEDRARVFMAAMLPGNEELFQKETLQDKLLCLCEGIREAYNLEDNTTVFPWEQYLQEPLAAEE